MLLGEYRYTCSGTVRTRILEVESSLLHAILLVRTCQPHAIPRPICRALTGLPNRAWLAFSRSGTWSLRIRLPLQYSTTYPPSPARNLPDFITAPRGLFCFGLFSPRPEIASSGALYRGPSSPVLPRPFFSFTSPSSLFFLFPSLVLYTPTWFNWIGLVLGRPTWELNLLPITGRPSSLSPLKTMPRPRSP